VEAQDCVSEKTSIGLIWKHKAKRFGL